MGELLLMIRSFLALGLGGFFIYLDFSITQSAAKYSFFTLALTPIVYLVLGGILLIIVGYPLNLSLISIMSIEQLHA